MAKRRRGRPRRVPGTRSRLRIEFKVTAGEWRNIRRLATANQMTVADFVRVGVLAAVQDLDEGANPILTLGGEVMAIISRF